jgi:5-methylcytosine-specific restriction endonuclease McrA
MDEWIEGNKDIKHIAREKAKAKELRQSQWWKNEKAKGICHYCQGKFSPKDLTMDHVVPLSRGGQSTKGNVVPCCKDCNNKKKYLTPADIIMNKLKKDD